MTYVANIHKYYVAYRLAMELRYAHRRAWGASVHLPSMGLSRPPRAMMKSTSAPALLRT